MTKKIERTQTGDDLVCKMVELDTLNKVIFDTDLKMQKVRGEINDLLKKLREERGFKDGTVSEEK